MTLSIECENSTGLYMKYNNTKISTIYGHRKGDKIPKSTEYSSEQLKEISKIICDDIFQNGNNNIAPDIIDILTSEKTVSCLIKVKFYDNYFYFSKFLLNNKEKYEKLPNYNKTKNMVTFQIDDIVFLKNDKKPKLVDYIKTYVENKSLFIKFIFDDYSVFSLPEFKNFVEFDDYLEFNNNLNDLFYNKDIYVEKFSEHQWDEKSTVFRRNKNFKDPYILRENLYFSNNIIYSNTDKTEISIIINIFDDYENSDVTELKLTPKKRVKSVN